LLAAFDAECQVLEDVNVERREVAQYLRLIGILREVVRIEQHLSGAGGGIVREGRRGRSAGYGRVAAAARGRELLGVVVGADQPAKAAALRARETQLVALVLHQLRVTGEERDAISHVVVADPVGRLLVARYCQGQVVFADVVAGRETQALRVAFHPHFADLRNARQQRRGVRLSGSDHVQRQERVRGDDLPGEHPRRVDVGYATTHIALRLTRTLDRVDRLSSAAIIQDARDESLGGRTVTVLRIRVA